VKTGQNQLAQLLVLFSLLTISTTGIASLLIEPEIGYSTSQQLRYTNAGTNYSFNESSTFAGLRVGYVATTGLWLALRGDAATSGTLTATNGTTNSDTFNRNTVAVEVGWQWQALRLLAGYQLLNTMTINPNVSNTKSPTNFSGTGEYAGVGIQFGNRFNLHALYETYSYSSVTGQNSTSQSLTSSAYSNVSDGNVSLSMSVAFSATGKSTGR